MNLTSPTRTLLLTTSLCLAALFNTAANAQSMVSVKGSTLNMREGPGTHTAVLWELKQGYPLQITERKGSWLRVRDFEGDTGWVARSLTGDTPHHVVKSKVANLRAGPGTQHRIVGRLEYGELLRTREKRADWVRVERSEGVSGWIAKRLLWGF
ncbi:MAG: SH3 domain-containing protein [Hydrogenophaga sp.]|jgi:SH3-like domain-containing protein|uniref:SH3 domain-containing protein n=1 Tax=Hydrogenophaga sp. TaxID=1904254 RepID=UPI00271D9096|nr:SH3 domain-containing protein [Hydrogenophaga sp.]MDO9134724.1 SH3 domain-containing protein [Hydrogenophaga sp.]MDO9506748.1 SH3 domain-containing protein [Hydrogenophaga sp.]MDP2987729.1 SH3 domain-containing protein [Hydrogenophaga sp.]MDP3203120.1 SH3 domain-containing protein [Hydrogenophaga sp.]MDP3626516.1 SH3 domain-containing protein [Hydrogenophaga sp.]